MAPPSLDDDDNNDGGTPGNSSSNSNSRTTLTLPAADLLRLIQAHLTQVGLHKTVACLQHESGVGMAGSLQRNWLFYAQSGNWAAILQSLCMLDRKRAHIPTDLIAATHEMTILELAEAGDLELAYAIYRLHYQDLEESMVDASDQKKNNKNNNNNNDNNKSKSKSKSKTTISRARVLEQKLAKLASIRANDPHAPIPDDFYAPSSSKQELRIQIGQDLQDAIPLQPSDRLTSLLQQAIKWQTYTGEMPRIKQWWQDEETEQDDEEAGKEGPARKKRKRKKQFDLVLGTVSVDALAVGEESRTETPKEKPVSDPYSIVKLGKKVTPEAAVFLPDASGLVTGSSDGLIEIWDSAQDYSQLKLDLPYQQREEMLFHDDRITALAVSRDGAMLASGSSSGQVKIWRLDTGKCLRTMEAHKEAISCLDFAPIASHVLTASRDGTAREFGLRTSRMLKEFRGHASFLTHCHYHTTTSQLMVITASGDGTVRLWDGKTSDLLRVLRPVSLGGALSPAGSSIVIDAQQSQSVGSGSASVHSVLHLHTPALTMMIVPRGYRAFLVNYSGAIIRTFEDSGGSAGEKVFVAAAVSPSNRLLYAAKEDGACCVFDIATGELEMTIRDFGTETARMPKGSPLAEVSAMFSHPSKNVIGGYCNDKGQKKGQVVLWK